MKKNRMFILLGIFFGGLAFAAAQTNSPTAPVAPPNAPAQIDIAGGKIVVRYAGRAIFEGAVESGNEAFQSRINVYRSGDRYRSTLVTSLTGSILLLTDKPAMYRQGDIEPARRTAPVLFTLLAEKGGEVVWTARYN